MSYVMRVQGTSMTAAGVLDGHRTMKRLCRRGGRLQRVPEPADGHVFPAMIVDEDVEVWGVVVGVARRCA